MAHPHNEHRQHKVERRRVEHITKGYASGGGVHADEAEDKKLIRKTVKSSAMKAEGKAPKHRMDKRARGGRTKHKGTTVNVIVPHAEGGAMPMHPAMAGPPPMAAAPAAPPPMALRPMMPPGGPPMGGPGPMPPGMPIRRSGGRAYASGGGVKDGLAWEEGLKAGTQVQHADGKSDGKDVGRGRVVTFWAGGKVKRKSGGKVGQTSGTAGASTPYHESVPRVKPLEAGIDKPRRAKGGGVEVPAGAYPATKLGGGSGGGEARLEKEKRARRDYKAA